MGQYKIKRLDKLTRGFIAKNTNTTIKLTTEVFELGIYIFKFQNGNILDQTARKDVESANKYISKLKKELENSNYTFEDLGIHKVYRNLKTLKYKTSL